MSKNSLFSGDIEKEKKWSKYIFFAGIFLCALSVISSGYWSNKTFKDAKNNAYVVQDGKLIKIELIDTFREGLSILSEGHIKEFHELFFTISPDLSFTKRNIEEKALFLIDYSGNQWYSRLNEDHYYFEIAKANYHVYVETDSIKVDYKKFPFKFTYYGKQRFEHEKNTFYRNLITKGYLDKVGITPNNLNGLKIKDLKLVNHSSL